MMGKLVQLPNPRRIRAQACVWLARIDAGLSEHDRKALEEWLASSPRHAEALLEMAKIWDEMDILSELSDLFPLRQYGPRPLRGPRWQRVALPVAAAACIAILGISLAWMLDSAPAPSPAPRAASGAAPVEAYETAVGDQSSVRLADGSLVVLNTDTRVEVRYSAAERTVYLRRGEATFTVTPDAARPFSVHAGDRVVQAIGTAFNVQLVADNDVEVTVTEGRVRVMLAPGVVQTASMPATLDLSSLDTTVAAGEIVRLEHDIGSVHGVVHKLEPEDIEIELAWHQGMLVFKGEPLATALREVGRYTTVNFELADPALGEIRVGGYFRAGDIDGLLVALRENFHIASQRVGDHILLAAE